MQALTKSTSSFSFAALASFKRFPCWLLQASMFAVQALHLLTGFWLLQASTASLLAWPARCPTRPLPRTMECWPSLAAPPVALATLAASGSSSLECLPRCSCTHALTFMHAFIVRMHAPQVLMNLKVLAKVLLHLRTHIHLNACTVRMHACRWLMMLSSANTCSTCSACVSGIM